MSYSPDTIRRLSQAFEDQRLLRPLRVTRYEPGTRLQYEVTGVAPSRKARADLEIERFVGGGFAGQVYRVKVVGLDEPDGPVEGLAVGGSYAMKILVPPSRFSCRFRDTVYAVGFQAPFQLQCNPAAARAGALWQKLIRRAAALRLGTERAVVNIHATFVDPVMGSCGELSEWIDGRNWRFEVDDRLEARRHWKHGQDVPESDLRSPEYRAKQQFMAAFVQLLHDVGAHEFARQYEWWTAKSQPNVLKRTDSEADPAAGLTAVDFRAGLALLPLLPMSPGDVPLIAKGVARGSLVQFDRGDLHKLRAFIEQHEEHFADLRPAFNELTEQERIYRNSQPDVTHNHVRLLHDGTLWGTMLDSTVTGWRVRNRIDDAAAAKLRPHRVLTLLFCLLGMLPALAAMGGVGLFAGAWIAGALSWPVALAAGLLVFLTAPLLRFVHRLIGRADLRAHYASIATSPAYALRAIRGTGIERLIGWVRRGRVSDERALALLRSPLRYTLHLPLGLLPAGLHRMLTDRAFALGRLRFLFVRPVRLYFNAQDREQWLRDMVTEGVRRGMLTPEEEATILNRIGEPFIQKYLQSLAVHVCTLPITQIVSVIVAAWYVIANDLSFAQAWDKVLLILAAFQITPISPGSFVRGAYVLYLVIRERNFKDYNIAVFLGFFKYVGYLAFPVQMAYRYPILARFMAGHWATGAVHIVPVFGEHGALLEHGVFDTFYNYPLTVRRRLRERAQLREHLAPRTWHAVPWALAVAAAFAAAGAVTLRFWEVLPALNDLWWLVVLGPLLAGAAVAAGAGGSPLPHRLLLAALTGVSAAVLAAVLYSTIGLLAVPDFPPIQHGAFWVGLVSLIGWQVFLFTLLAILGAFIAETRPVKDVQRVGYRT